MSFVYLNLFKMFPLAIVNIFCLGIIFIFNLIFSVVLEAISILATISLALSLLGLVIVLQFHCHTCGRKYSYHNYVTSAAIVQFTAGIYFVIIHEKFCYSPVLLLYSKRNVPVDVCSVYLY